MYSRNELLTFSTRGLVAMLNGDHYIATGTFEDLIVGASAQVAVVTGPDGCLYESLNMNGEVSELEITLYEGSEISGGYEVIAVNLNRIIENKVQTSRIYGGFDIDVPGDVIYSGSAVGSSAWPGGLTAGIAAPLLLKPDTTYILDVKNVSINGLDGTISLSNTFTDSSDTIYKIQD